MTVDFEFRPGARVDLAQTSDFDLGAARVSPARRRVTLDGHAWDLEPRVMRVLIALAAASPKVVSREDLTEACWDGRIVGDDAMNRCILSLRNLARSHTPELFRIETVRGVGYSLVAPTAPEAASADGVGSASPPADSPPDVAGRLRRFAPVLVALLAVAAAGLAWLGWRSLGTGVGAPSVARLEMGAFQPTRAGDPDLARVTQATRGALIHVLRGADIPVVEAATPGGDPSSDADFRLRGAVDRDGDTMVINVQVLDRQQRNVLWSGRVERPLAAPARFPDQAASRIGDVLLCALRSRAASNRPMTDAVLSMVMQACELRRAQPEGARKFLAAAERLRAAAPNLSGAQSMYAMAAAVTSALSPDAPQAPAFATAARAAAHRALQLDPRNGEAYFAIGISYGFDNAWAEREANFLRAEALTNGFSVVGDLHVGLLREVGRVREARELNRRTVADDPLAPDQIISLSLLTAAAEGSDAAEPLVQQLRLLAPPEDVDDVRFTTTFWWADPKDAAARLPALRTAPTAFGKPCFLDYLAALNRPAPRRGLPETCRTLQADWRIRMLAREGDIDGAYREIAQARRGSQFLIALYYPEMRAFRADPRFMPLAQRYGLVDYWTRSGHWPDFCAEPDRPYDCAAVARALPTSSATR